MHNRVEPDCGHPVGLVREVRTPADGPLTPGSPAAHPVGASTHERAQPSGEVHMLGWILVIVLLMLVIGSVPAYPYSRRWGYAPSGLLGVVLIVVLILALLNYFPAWP